MSDLSLTFEELYEEVEKFLGTYSSGSASATDLADAKFIVNRAYSRYCSYWDWTFLSQERTLEIIDGVYKYELPSDFSYFVGHKFTFDADGSYPDIVERMPLQIKELRSDANYENYPMYYALQAGSYHKSTGQGWEVWFYPIPDSAYTLHYSCKINPQKLVDAGDIPIGGADMSDCLLELCLAYAEQNKDEKMLVHNEVVNSILGPAKVMDSRRRSTQLGNLSDGLRVLDIDGDSVHSGNVIVSS